MVPTPAPPVETVLRYLEELHNTYDALPSDDDGSAFAVRRTLIAHYQRTWSRKYEKSVSNGRGASASKVILIAFYDKLHLLDGIAAEIGMPSFDAYWMTHKLNLLHGGT